MGSQTYGLTVHCNTGRREEAHLKCNLKDAAKVTLQNSWRQAARSSARMSESVAEARFRAEGVQGKLHCP